MDLMQRHKRILVLGGTVTVGILMVSLGVPMALRAGNNNNLVRSVAQTAPTTAPVEEDSFQEDAAAEEPGPESTDRGGPSSFAESRAIDPAFQDQCCPDDFTGFQPYDGCRQYFKCVAGDVDGPPKRCREGKIFDVSIQTCGEENIPCVTESCSGRL